MREQFFALRGDELNRVIDEKGAHEARRFARTKAERRRIDTAMALRESRDVGVIYACAAIATLPHRAGESLDHWEQQWYGDHYRWEQGHTVDGAVGLPSGPLARRILTHFVSEAVRAEARKSNLDPSLYRWSRSLTHASMGGVTYRNVAAQLRRIGACRLTVTAHETNDDFRRIDVTWPGGESLADRAVSAVLGALIASEQLAGVVTLRRAAFLQIARSSVSIDLYIWLAWRLPNLSQSEAIEWSTLAAMFCAGYKQQRQSKPLLTDALCLVLVVYPQAQVELLPEGIVLYPSPPPVAS